MNSLAFVKQFLGHPAQTGAIHPSSPYLARQIVKTADIRSDSAVLELGPGTGVFTKEIAQTLSTSNTFLAIEINKAFAQLTQQRCPRVTVIHDSAAHARQHLNALGLEYSDRIISGLPWAAFDPQLQDTLISAVLDCLPIGGRFVTFAYLQGLLLPAGRRFKRKLQAYFTRIGHSPTVWRNLPPALVYWAEK
ncbi:class I SAM-dependent methyltransferase [Planctomycetota bacterium]